MADFNNITLHKPLPVRKAILYVTGGPHTIDNLLSESNLLFDASTGRDGYGGERMLLLKPKLTLYFNRFDATYWSNILLQVYSTTRGRFPLKILLGGSDLTRIENPGEQWLSFTNEPNILTARYNLASANKFFKSGLVWTGVIRPNVNFYGDNDPA